MGRFQIFKAAFAAAILFAPGFAQAGPIFDGTTPSSDFRLFPFWTKVIADMNQTAGKPSAAGLLPAALTGTPEPAGTFNPGMTPCSDERHCAPPAWTSFLSGLVMLDPRAQLESVNRWANAKPYVEDITNWGIPDYWETPGEFIAHGGDCEDFAIAKYFSLVRLGFSPRDLRIVIVSDSKAHDFHAVLVAHLGDTNWLLDNQLPEIVQLDSEPQYTPIYSLNEQGWWLHSQPFIQVAANIVITTAPMTPMTPAATPVRLAKAD